MSSVADRKATPHVFSWRSEAPPLFVLVARRRPILAKRRRCSSPPPPFPPRSLLGSEVAREGPLGFECSQHRQPLRPSVGSSPTVQMARGECLKGDPQGPLGPLGSSSSHHRRTLELVLQKGPASFRCFGGALVLCIKPTSSPPIPQTSKLS